MSERLHEADHAEIGDLGRVLNILQQASAEARRELGRRKDEARIAAGASRVVSDHAVIRYLERAKEMDIEAIRLEISTLADQSQGFAHVDDAVWNAEHKLVLIIDDGMIVTVLSEAQSDKYIGRRLRDGDRAGASK